MIKRFHITVDIDTDSSFHKTGLYQDTLDENKYTIRICKDLDQQFPDKHNIPVALAHEFGHIIGYAMDLPRSKKDPRNMHRASTRDFMGLLAGYTDDLGERIIKSEKEAWDFANIILSMKKLKKVALAGYLKEWSKTK